MKSNKEKILLIEALKKTPIIQIVCERTNIARATYYRWRKEDSKFAKLADEAIIEGCLLINDMAESQLISAIKDKNMTAIALWLRNHHKVYTDKLEINHQINGVDEQLTPKQKAIVRAALRLASLGKKHEK
jgi:predicted DNA binding protein